MTDEELVAEILDGSKSAIDVLVRRHYKAIYAYVYRKTSDKTLSYDLTQEIFIKMLKYLHSYKKQSAFKNWLITITINHIRDYYRSKAAKQESLQGELHEDQLKSKEKDIPFIFEKKLERQAVKEAIQTLPDYQSEALILKYYHDLKISEIAEVTNASESTVKSRLRQGLFKLKDLLLRGDYDEAQNIKK